MKQKQNNILDTYLGYQTAEVRIYDDHAQVQAPK